MLSIRPVTFKDASIYVNRYHRHHISPQGWKYGISVYNDDNICGVAIVGRPVARLLQDGFTLEVTRCCTDGTKNACSKLYSYCWRIAREMGYRRMVTYILSNEPGTSLLAAGWHKTGDSDGGRWSCASRPRNMYGNEGSKTRWEPMYVR